MGVIDQTVNRFTCDGCKVTEEATVAERGSRWGADWDHPSALDHFDVQWAKNRYGEPQPIAWRCKGCGSSNVTVDRR